MALSVLEEFRRDPGGRGEWTPLSYHCRDEVRQAIRTPWMPRVGLVSWFEGP